MPGDIPPNYPAQPPYSNVQSVQAEGVPGNLPPDVQAQWAIQRDEEQRRAIAQRMGEVATRAAQTSGPF